MRKSKKRRGRGEASIYQRKSDGRWVGAIVVGYNAETGKPRRKVVYGKTKEEVQAALDELRGKVKAGLADGDSLPLRRAIDFWLSGQVKPHADEATYRLYQQRIRDHILPQLGGHPVAAITPYMVQAWNEELERQGCTPNLRKNCAKLLRRCLDQCVKYGYIRTNPAASNAYPARTPKTFTPSTPTRSSASWPSPADTDSPPSGSWPWTRECGKGKCWPWNGPTWTSPAAPSASRSRSAPRKAALRE